MWVNGYRRHSQNSCSYLLPLTGVEPESSGEHVSPVTTTISSRASLSELNVTVPHVLFSASKLSLPVNSRGGGGRGHVASLRLVDLCWLLHCLRLHVLDPDCLSAARWVAVLFVCSLCVALAVFVSWTRGVSLPELTPQ